MLWWLQPIGRCTDHIFMFWSELGLKASQTRRPAVFGFWNQPVWSGSQTPQCSAGLTWRAVLALAHKTCKPTIVSPHGAVSLSHDHACNFSNWGKLRAAALGGSRYDRVNFSFLSSNWRFWIMPSWHKLCRIVPQLSHLIWLEATSWTVCTKKGLRSMVMDYNRAFPLKCPKALSV